MNVVGRSECSQAGRMRSAIGINASRNPSSLESLMPKRIRDSEQQAANTLAGPEHEFRAAALFGLNMGNDVFERWRKKR